ncbi:MAG: YfhO family protein, partial [Clostridiales bacterium]|nr:YfhO family protein [Clostridiales bacterium]
SRDKYIKLADALLAVSVTPGEHTITMDYSPVGFKFGCAVSGSTLLLIIAFFIIKSLRNKKKRALENEPSFPVYIEAAAQDGEEADVQDGVEADVQDDEADVQDDEAAAAQDEEEITAQGEEEAAAQDGAEISEEPS